MVKLIENIATHNSPNIHMKEEKTHNSGIIHTNIITCGKTRKLRLENLAVCRASISLLTIIVPMMAAKAAP
jgi:hypothetical protein